MFCPHCGQETPDGSKFCQACGATLAAKSPAQDSVSTAFYERPFAKSQGAQSDRYTFRWAIRTCLKERYACFKGRACRSEYWYFCLFSCLILGVLCPIGMTLAYSIFGDNLISLIAALAILLGPLFYLLIPGLAVSVRRMHDLGYSGWWLLLAMLLSWIPLLDVLIGLLLTIFFALKGSRGPNAFGADPLQE
ncbi:MAG: DUF805 domain-containing protein [Succinivibrio sp.]|nr:DUF805 domain-containing protein [Succinivibrio sp.]